MYEKKAQIQRERIEIAFVIPRIASDEIPDYKAPFLLVVLVLPVVGLMLYMLFHSRMLEDLKTAKRFIFPECFIMEESMLEHGSVHRLIRSSVKIFALML